MRPEDFNPAWMLAGDRESLFYLELKPREALHVRELLPCTYVLENAALDATSRKVTYVRSLLRSSVSESAAFWNALPSLLSNHVSIDPYGADATSDADATRARETWSRACTPNSTELDRRR